MRPHFSALSYSRSRVNTSFRRISLDNPVLPTMLVAAALSGLCATDARASCGAAFCMVNTNWDVQGLAASPGLRLDLRYEFIKQDQPMSGSHKVAVGQISRDHDEVKTTNRNLIGTIDYTLNERWAMSMTVPYMDRSHLHFDNDSGAPVPEQWDFKRFGDIRVLGRYQGRSEKPEAGRLNFYGVNFGVKLPTGTKDIRNSDGQRAERTLQPGTGTTDLLLGGFYSAVLGQSDSSWFVQALWQVPLNSSEDYKPGKRVTFDVGYRYAPTDKIGLMLQFNALHRGRDSGLQADAEDSGGNFLYLSPGVSYTITRSLQLYGFVQKPIYQHVNGVQLTADWSALAGITARF